jgi:hypothetical protein
MKIFFLKPGLFITATIIGILLAFALSPMTTPVQVEQKPIEITPVPTPAPVYVQPSVAPTVVPTGSYSTLSQEEKDALMVEELVAAVNTSMSFMLPAVIGLVVITILLSAIRTMVDRGRDRL